MKQKSFEKAIEQLDEIVTNLEDGDLALEESIKLFEEGMQLSKFCMEKLSQAERKLQKLTKTGDSSFQLELM